MRTVAEFAAFDQATTTCCRLVQEGANEDPHAYDCANCELAAHYATLERDPLALKLWRLWQLVASRFTFDAACAGPVFDRLTRHYTDDEYEVAVRGMAVLYNAFCPLPEKKDA